MLLAQALHAEACAKEPPIMDKGLRFHLVSIQIFYFTLPRYEIVKPFGVYPSEMGHHVGTGSLCHELSHSLNILIKLMQFFLSLI